VNLLRLAEARPASRPGKDFAAADAVALLRAALARDERAWTELVRRFDGPLRKVVREATDAIHPLADVEIDDVLGEFWLGLVEDDFRRLRALHPSRGSALRAWLVLHVSQVAHDHLRRLGHEPPLLPLHEARHVADPSSEQGPGAAVESTPTTRAERPPILRLRTPPAAHVDSFLSALADLIAERLINERLTVNSADGEIVQERKAPSSKAGTSDDGQAKPRLSEVPP